MLHPVIPLHIHGAETPHRPHGKDNAGGQSKTGVRGGVGAENSARLDFPNEVRRTAPASGECEDRRLGAPVAPRMQGV